ncbi:hypothetical protein [Curtobacterium flaccumfaciens]|uniref:hypothetical protein n=1 Tax=Curtobacterium flaccumfaciens TaxID=2035 RepID=UPI003879EFCF
MTRSSSGWSTSLRGSSTVGPTLPAQKGDVHTTTTPPRVVIDSGTRPYLRLAGVVGTHPVVFTEADLRSADGEEYRDFLRDARKRSNLEVIEVGFGNTDKTFTVRHRVPSLTSVPARPTKTQTVPPKVKPKRKRSGRR